jgi:hypothetical protein
MNELIQKHNYLTNDLSAETTQFLSIFCPVKEKIIKIICKTSDYYKAIYGTYLDTNELSISVKYGWTIFHICQYHSLIFHNWNLYTKPFNEILPIPCHKNHFKMFILYDKTIPPSLFNLCMSSLFQYQLNIVLKKNKYILPTTICQQAPPCHIYHIDPFHVRSPHECYYCRNKKPNSTFIYDW